MSVDTLLCQAILFDMDGTLVDSGGVVERAWEWWGNKHNFPIGPILAVQAGRPNREVLRQFASHLDLEEEARSFKHYEETDIEGVVALPGVPAVVAAAQKGKWSVVTSADRTLAEVRLNAAGIPIPEVLITADMLSHGKPDPECFLLAAEKFQVPRESCVVFEDAPAGIAAARAAGMRVVGVMTAFDESQLHADWHIRDFRDVQIAYSGGVFTIQISNE